MLAIEGGKVMAVERTMTAFGCRVYGLGVMALGLVCLAWGDFDLGQPVPKDFPDRAALAYAAAAFMIVAGAAVGWRRTRAWGAAALTVYYALIVVLLMNGRVVLARYTEFGTYSGVAEQVAIMAGGVIVYAASAKIDAARAARLTRLGQLAFGVCALLFGGAHFFYMNLTIPLVPKWLPPTQEFWAYATGVGHIAAGIAILTGVQARLAAILLTAMYASFTLLVHGPILLANSSSRTNWSENALNLALIGVAWVVADSSDAAEALTPIHSSTGMAYSDLTIGDRNPFKRWLQRRRYSDALAALRKALLATAFAYWISAQETESSYGN
jgi:uncharacterized membrane protein YphA (DoxX/SURF4 family)